MQGPLARNLPETALYAASRRPTTQPTAAPYTCSVAWVGEALHGDVNHPHINGMQGVRGSNPLSSTTTTPQVSITARPSPHHWLSQRRPAGAALGPRPP